MSRFNSEKEKALISEMIQCREMLEEASSSVQDPEKKQSFDEAIASINNTLSEIGNVKNLELSSKAAPGKGGSFSSGGTLEDDKSEDDDE